MLVTRLASESRRMCARAGHHDKPAVAVRIVRHLTGLGAVYRIPECASCAKKAHKTSKKSPTTARVLYL